MIRLGFKAIKQQLRRKVSMANKRLQRLEGNQMQEIPAYKMARDMLGNRKRFTSAGDDINELRKELARVDKFLNAKTSTVRGANRNMKEIAARTGIKYKSVKELPQKTQKFFELASKVEQYLKNVEGSYHAVGYQKVWETVSEYIEDNDIDLTDPNFDVEDYLDDLIQQTSPDSNDEPDWDSMEWFTVD